MKKNSEIIIVGAGGFGREVLSWIETDPRKFNVKGFLSPNKSDLDGFKNMPPILGSEMDYKVTENDLFILAIGDVPLKEKIAMKLKERGANFANYIHHTAYVANNVTMGEGVIVGPLTCVSNKVHLDDFVTINASCVIGHDAIVEKYAVISPQSGMMGFSKLSAKSFLGAHCVVAPKMVLGTNVVVSANTTVLRDVPENMLVASPLPRMMPRF